MGEHYAMNTGDFAEYLQSIVKLNVLEKMTQDLDKELTDSQNIMMEIKAIYNTVSHVENSPTEPENNGLRHEDVSTFLESGVPKLLMPDMTENNMDVDIDVCIATLKRYAEELKNNIVTSDENTPRPKDLVKLDLNQYAQSLDQLSKRVANIKINKKDELNNRNIELEGKLTILCDDVNKFTTMVQAKTAISESNKNWQPSDSNSLQYDCIISKLLSGINEVSYLLQNKN
ncbi:unnamed protein product [Arctia plantaginis]|uniref:Uncharacterized protein n=1 Tax=Arctia plantaginis TaxID=874455 RepID=A0A8S1BBX8_ARCPL|nr:unnamed protein product [Arctia plantaginis]CAB3259319.1 unnamed protein product [Arctia plantaginis]